MAFNEEWVDKKNKTPTEPGDKLNADDLNLLARGIKEALVKAPNGKIPTKVSDLEDADEYATKDYVNGHIPDYKALKISGDENGGSIYAGNSENPLESVLEISSYALKFEGATLKFNVTNPAIGLKVATPTEENEAVNKRYVDNLVGDITAALEEIRGIEDELIARGFPDVELPGDIVGEVTPPDEQ